MAIPPQGYLILKKIFSYSSPCPPIGWAGAIFLNPASRYRVSAKLRAVANRFSKGWTRIRKVWCANFQGICSSEFIVLPGNDHIDPQFRTLRLNAIDFVTFANSLNTGDRPRVDFDQISSFFLLPSSFFLGETASHRRQNRSS